MQNLDLTETLKVHALIKGANVMHRRIKNLTFTVFVEASSNGIDDFVSEQHSVRGNLSDLLRLIKPDNVVVTIQDSTATETLL